jgi:type VI secretion system secreted protein Hcp
MAIYLKFGKIEGNVSEKGHEKWLDVHSLQFGIGRGISTPTGNTGNREASLPSVSEVTITRTMDGASAYLMQAVLGKSKAETAKIDLVETGESENEVYANYELTNTLISGYSVSSGGDRPSESLTLNFTKVEFSITPRGADNKAGQPIKAIYDISKGVAG